MRQESDRRDKLYVSRRNRLDPDHAWNVRRSAPAPMAWAAIRGGSMDACRCSGAYLTKCPNLSADSLGFLTAYDAVVSQGVM